MILWLLILLPTLCGLAAYLIRPDRLRRVVWAAVAILHFVLAVLINLGAEATIAGVWIGLDALSRLFLMVTSLLFLAATFYGIGSLRRDALQPHPEMEEDNPLFRSRPEAVFTGCMLLFLASMTVVVLSRNFGLQWVAVEATTLASAPLIYFHRNRRSLEAAWKYLLICSVGIALALVGVFCIALAGTEVAHHLTVDAFTANAGALNPRWLKLAFLFLLVGYGAKMGLAPLHNWLPDAHSEAPSPVSALLSGALLNCAFIGILRLQQVCFAAGIADFGRELLVLFGLISMGLAGVFILRQADYKRMLAYSSVEHMGILALGVGLAGTGVFGALLHAVNHSLVKAMLFMAAGNILWAYRTKRVADVRGVARRLPASGVLWLGGFLAIVGSPPFGTFISEFTILKTALDQGRWTVAALYLAFLTLVFVGMAGIIIRMSLGEPDPQQPPVRTDAWCVVPPMVCGGLALVLGFYIPEGMQRLLHHAAALIGGVGL
jgi:hydrogenase-4 component F